MELAEWLSRLAPGTITDLPDRREIRHPTGDVSTFWRRVAGRGQGSMPDVLVSTGAYEMWDGADLFSSAFKLAAVGAPEDLPQVRITGCLAELGAEATAVGWDLPSGAVPFMVGSGQWLYAATTAGTILEYDLEDGAQSGQFASLAAVIEEWLRNVAE